MRISMAPTFCHGTTSDCLPPITAPTTAWPALANDQLSSFVETLKRVCCAQARTIDRQDCADVRGELVHLSLEDIPDPQVRARLQAIPTGLTIPPEDVALLVSSGEQAVQQNPRIRALISGLDRASRGVAAGAGARDTAR